MDPVHDAAGNMTEAPSPADPTVKHKYVYDAWNRLAKVTNASDVSIQENEYDGLNRRIVKIDKAASPDVTYDYYYNQQWQVLEVRKNGSANPEKQYVYHPQYVDSIALRYYDENTGGAGIVEHYYLQDANFNVTAITDNAGTVVERYAYTPYGEVTVLNPDFSAVAGNVSAIGNEHLYTGRRLDPETGLQLNRNRFYAAGLGRWVNRDPIGYRGGMNLYGYVDSRPTFWFDPWGLDPTRPGEKPSDAPPGTIPIDQHDGTKDKVHEIKDQLKEDGVGPGTYVGISPEGEIIVPDADGNADNLGHWNDYVSCDGTPKPRELPPRPWYYWITPIETKPGQGFIGPFGPPITMPFIPGGIIPIGPPLPSPLPVPVLVP